ncbi:hypothetical protein METBIDRAFT_36817 [Metschnikowia bicuspidata var. bicuspidata NRRL YB-4993]|uniref:GOLD domain-containing protein n=1 Tax=Metschnikowia bicuspidata var. bicuspidata NRRL YB-4993 TaxID=869754 RepID=A0A1A0HK22_9ASCO|nr:hypothetical protein METBIDRAFT_36817 [Metschnikowia bicuspidata var. bicuspidata NRRL YB-4993]OBA24351.1 hypothetical protein METBIDRAFT_36817 [Metschnikowia bicuspidata var. bicuspidata NRRL YB-4993]
MFSRCLLLLALVQTIVASALTFSLPAKEVSCFYIFTEKPNTQVSYYFAVQQGGSFDVDYSVKDPLGNELVARTKERQGDFVITAKHVGEYEFCFSNQMSTFADKVIDFEIKYDDDASSAFRAQMPEQPNTQPLAHVEAMKATASQIDAQLEDLKRSLQYYKTRNNRNQATVRSTESRIYYFSILEVLLMVGMAGLQITIVQLFFKGSRKQLV